LRGVGKASVSILWLKVTNDIENIRLLWKSAINLSANCGFVETPLGIFLTEMLNDLSITFELPFAGNLFLSMKLKSINYVLSMTYSPILL